MQIYFLLIRDKKRHLKSNLGVVECACNLDLKKARVEGMAQQWRVLATLSEAGVQFLAPWDCSQVP